jgi:hypothetical protein
MTLTFSESQRPRMTFCWLPPERLRMSWRTEGVFDAQLGGAVAGVGLLPGFVDEDAGARGAAAGAEVDVFQHGADGDDALFLAIFGAEHDAGFDGGARRTEGEFAAGEGDAAGGFRGGAEEEF